MRSCRYSVGGARLRLIDIPERESYCCGARRNAEHLSRVSSRARGRFVLPSLPAGAGGVDLAQRGRSLIFELSGPCAIHTRQHRMGF